jgi:hypothetical protein
MLLLFLPQVAPPLGVDLADVIAELIPQLGAGTEADLVFWTAAELYQFADEGAKKLARGAGVFIDRDTFTEIAAITPTYNLPARHISTIHASIDTRALKETGVDELEARDNAWPAAIADANGPQRFLEDATVGSVLVYPMPAATAGHLAVIFNRFPETVAAGNTTLSMPLAVRDWFRFYIEAAARAKESKGAMPEVAGWFTQLTGMYEQVARSYWGGAE